MARLFRADSLLAAASSAGVAPALSRMLSMVRDVMKGRLCEVASIRG
jgi:hypothetical protein